MECKQNFKINKKRYFIKKADICLKTILVKYKPFHRLSKDSDFLYENQSLQEKEALRVIQTVRRSRILNRFSLSDNSSALKTKLVSIEFEVCLNSYAFLSDLCLRCLTDIFRKPSFLESVTKRMIIKMIHTIRETN